MRIWLILTIVLGAAAPVAGQSLEDYDYEQLTFRGMSFDIGHIAPNKVEGAAVYTLRVDLGYLGPHVRIVPSFAYWSSRIRVSELERLSDQLSEWGGQVSAEVLAPIDWSSYSMSTDARVVWVSPIGLSPYAGAGLGVYALNGNGPAINETFIEDLLDTVSAGVAAVAGAEFVFSRGIRIHFESRYTLLSDLRYGSLHLGGGFMLPASSAGGVGP